MASEPRSTWPRWIIVAPLILAGLASVSLVKNELPACLFHEVTGWHCPGCGATRATEALVGFRWLDALHQNAFFTLAVLLGIPFILLSAVRERFPEAGWLRPFRWSLSFLWIALALLLLFAVVRNVPGVDWLAPF